MTRLARIVGIVFLCAVSLGVVTPPALAGSSAAERLQATREHLAQVQAMLDAAKQREATLGGQVASYDAQLARIGGDLARLDAQLAKVRADLTHTRKRLVVLRERLERKRVELAAAKAELKLEQHRFEQRVIGTYKQGEVDYLDVLLGSNDYHDFVTRIGLVRTLVGGVNAQVGHLEEVRDRVDREERSLAADQVAMEKARVKLEDQDAKLAELRATQLAQQQSLAAARAAKNGVLQQVATTRRAFEAQEDQLLAESQQLAAIIAGSGGGSVKGTGRFVWPTAGPVTSGFGWRIHPIFGVKKFHSGIDISAPQGQAIVAADSGTIIYAGSGMTGYGNVIVIDHGDGLSSLYCHMSGYAVTSGGVRRGRVIGYVGSTGFSTGPHLHFEVRVNGNPVDPMGYLN